jgi:nucleotide-binding universal stress UspA family protein
MGDYPKYKNVLFCTDFSENSEWAFNFAFGIAKRDDSIFYILHVIAPQNIYPYDLELMKASFGNKEWTNRGKTIRQTTQKQFDEKYLSRIDDKSKVKFVIRDGREDEEIIKFSKEKNIDIIVVGSHGRVVVEHTLLGSVAEKVVSHSVVPVFVIPAFNIPSFIMSSQKQKFTDYPKYKKVLFCTDFSECSDLAFDYASGTAKRDDGFLYILHVIPTQNIHQYDTKLFGDTEVLNRIQKLARKEIDKNCEEKYLNKIEDKSKVTFVVREGHEDEEIMNFAKNENIDLIVVGTHCRTGINRALLGSVAGKIIRHSQSIPVFIIPGTKEGKS